MNEPKPMPMPKATESLVPTATINNTNTSTGEECSDDSVFTLRRKLRNELLELIRDGQVPPQTLPYPTDAAAESLAAQLNSDTSTIRTVVAHIRASGDHLDTSASASASTALPNDEGFFYFVFNKPAGAICARFREADKVRRAEKQAKKAAKFAANGKVLKQVGEPFLSVFDTLPPGYPPVPHVGRLDKDTCGLLMFTDNSALHQPLLNKIMNKQIGAPSLSKIYDVDVNASKSLLHKFGCLNLAYVLESMCTPLDYLNKQGSKEGVVKFTTDAAKVHMVEDLGVWPLAPGAQVRLRVEISEGRNRQVRRLCKRAGVYVVRLMRQNFGTLELRDLKLGEARPLTQNEVQGMFDTFAVHYPGLVGRKRWEEESMLESTADDGAAASECVEQQQQQSEPKRAKVDETIAVTADQQEQQQQQQHDVSVGGEASAGTTRNSTESDIGGETTTVLQSSDSPAAATTPAAPYTVKLVRLPHPAYM